MDATNNRYSAAPHYGPKEALADGGVLVLAFVVGSIVMLIVAIDQEFRKAWCSGTLNE